MHRFRLLVRHPVWQPVCFLLVFLALSWPFVTPHSDSMVHHYGYVFSVWLVLIGILALMGDES